LVLTDTELVGGGICRSHPTATSANADVNNPRSFARIDL
jgi:hypothetical protein